MSFGTLFLTIIFIIVGVWLFRAFRRVRRLYRMLFYGEMPENKQGQNTRTSGDNRRYGYGSPRNRKTKLYSPQDGEYVEFEEISVDTTHINQGESASYVTEEQVVDAEWEDIKS